MARPHATAHLTACRFRDPDAWTASRPPGVFEMRHLFLERSLRFGLVLYDRVFPV